jgi:hypothetical protein
MPREISNNNLVAASRWVASMLARIRVGDVVRLTGQLVNITTPSGAWFGTSLTRKATGPGACEIILARMVETRSLG